jgi:hypothetical protein
MSKYKVGDIVKLRDDLEDGKKYGTVRYDREMDFIKGKPMELIAKSTVFENCYITKDEEYVEWYISDEMIQGLWEECKGIAYEPYEEKTNKLRLIDILNKIANGELKEGTKLKYKDIDLIYEDEELVDDEGFSAADFFRSKADYNEEVELIEPHHIREDTKMIEPTDNTKIEELDILEIEDNQNIDNLGLAKSIGDLSNTIREIQHKLNEVIRYINK